jgi:ssDNA-binding Zn-finger/Zn-ribbon topoisomerase 1
MCFLFEQKGLQMGALFTELVEPNVAECPSCGGRLTLYRRPVNVEFLECAACQDEFTPDYIAGFSAGITRAAQLHVQPTGVGAPCPDCKVLRFEGEDTVLYCEAHQPRSGG